MTVRVGIIDSGLPDGTVRAGDSSTRLLRDFTTDQCVVDRLGHGSAGYSPISAGPRAAVLNAKIISAPVRTSPDIFFRIQPKLPLSPPSETSAETNVEARN